MKRFLLAVGVLGLVSATAVPALATVEVTITDSTGTTVYVGSSCGVSCSTDVISAADADFTILIQTATSNGPGGPAVLTYNTQVAAKSGAATGPLTISISDTGFTLPAGNGTLVQTLNTNTSALTSTATGTLTGTGYYGTGAGNVFFCQETSVCNNNTPNASFSSFLVTNPGQTESTAVSPFAVPFSLDAVLTATFTSGQACFSVLVSPTGCNAEWQGTLSAVANVPEPASVALLGGVLVILTTLMRRKKLSV